MEKRDLYDENRNRLNETISASDSIPSGKYILIVAIFIQNENNEFLIQKTSPAKGSVFATTGGHVVAGEDSLAGLIREIKEEIDIDLKDYPEPTLFKKVKTNDHLLDLYYLKVKDLDISKLSVQKEEVDYLKWMKADEINSLIESGEFRTTHIKMFKDCLEYLNK